MRQRSPRTSPRFGITLCAFSFLLGLVALTTPLAACAQVLARPLEHVTLQLKWKHQFQFAGYYAAIEKGYYRDAGFEVSLVEPTGNEDPVDLVLADKAQYGIGASELALHRARGKQVVVLATILQHSPLVLIAAGGSDLTVHDLGGKRLMLVQYELELIAYLIREGLSLDRFQLLPHSFSPSDLMEGKVDALSGYATDDFLRSVAQSAGVNADEALAYAQTDAAADQLNQANSEAQTRGIDSTPSFVVTGKDGKAHVVVGHDDASLTAAIKAAR